MNWPTTMTFKTKARCRSCNATAIYLRPEKNAIPYDVEPRLWGAEVDKTKAFPCQCKNTDWELVESVPYEKPVIMRKMNVN